MKKYFLLPLGLILSIVFNSVAFAVIAPGGFDYSNDKHGFYLVMPAGWDDYKVTEEELGDETYFDFSLPTTEVDTVSYPDGYATLFTITATSGDPVMMAEYLGENSQYKFYFTHLNGFPPVDLEDRVLEFDQIKSTFMASEPTNLPFLDAFSDTLGHQYEEAINFVFAEGAVEGYEDGTYKPNNPVNRAEFTKILMESVDVDGEIESTNLCYQTYDTGLTACAGDGECGLQAWEDFAECTFNDTASNITDEQFDNLIKYDVCFPDVPKGEWFTKYVCLAKMKDIIGGYPDGNFKPANNINLAESLKIIMEISASMADTTIEPVEGEWYQVYFDLANGLNLIDTINVDSAHFLTRGEMAELMYQIAQLAL